MAMIQTLQSLCEQFVRGDNLNDTELIHLRQTFESVGKHPEIWHLATIHSPILICFNAFVKKILRDSQDLKQSLGDTADREDEDPILQMIGFFVRAPPNMTGDIKNVYLSVLGFLMANCIHKYGKAASTIFVKTQSDFKLNYEDSHTLTYHYEHIKYIGACLSELMVLIRDHTVSWYIFSKLWAFHVYCAEKFGCIIQNTLEEMSRISRQLLTHRASRQQFTKSCEVAKKTLVCAIDAIECLQGLLGHSNSGQYSTPGLKFNIFDFDDRVNLLEWHRCFIESVASSLIDSLLFVQLDLGPHSESTIVCLILNTLLGICRLVDHSVDDNKENTSESTLAQVRRTILNMIYSRVVYAHLSQTFHTHPQKHINRHHNYNIQSLFLKLVLEVLQVSKQDSQIAFPNSHHQVLKSYCQINLKNIRITYQFGEDCPFLLSILVLDAVIGVEIRGAHHCQVQHLIEQSASYKYDLFNEYVCKKLVKGSGRAADSDRDTIDQSKEFVCEILTKYFSILVKYGPKYFATTPTTTSGTVEECSQTKCYSLLGQTKDCETSDAEPDQNPSRDIGLFSWLLQQTIGLAQKHETTTILPVLSFINAVLANSPDGLAKCEIYHKLWKLQIVIQQNVSQSSDRIDPLDRTQAYFCVVHILYIFLNQLMPQSYAQEGENASLMTVFLPNAFVDYIIESIQVLTCIVANISEVDGQSSIETNTQACQKHYEQVNGLITFILFVLEIIATKLYKRTMKLEDENNDEQFRKCEDILNFIYDEITSYDFVTPEANLGQYSIISTLMEIFEHKGVYETYDILKSKTLLTSTNQLKLHLYFSAVTGLLKHCYDCRLIRILVQLVLEDIRILKSTGCLLITEDLYETFIPFVKYMTSPRVVPQNHDKIALEIEEIFLEELRAIIPQTVNIYELRNDTLAIYTHMAKIESLSLLIALPENHRNLSLPEQLLNLYFENLNRVKNVGQLEYYSSKNITWFLEMIEYRIQNQDTLPPLQIDLNSIAHNFRMQDPAIIRQLASLLHNLIPQNRVSHIEETLNRKRHQLILQIEEQRHKSSQILKSIAQHKSTKKSIN